MYRIILDLYGRQGIFYIKEKNTALQLNSIVIFNAYAEAGKPVSDTFLNELQAGNFITYDEEYRGRRSYIKVEDIGNVNHADELGECMRFIYCV